MTNNNNNHRRNTGTSQRSASGRSTPARGTGRTGSARTSSTRTTTSSRNYVSSSRNNTSSKKSSGGGGAAAIAAVIIVVAIAVIGIFTWSGVSYLYDEDIIIPGVEVDGINISGMTRDEAYTELSNRLNEKINQLSVTLNYNGSTWTYDASQLNVSGEVSYIVDNVLLYGHTGNLRQRMDEAEYIKNNAEPFYITFVYDQNALRQIVEALKPDIDIEAVEPSLVFDETAGRITGIEDRTALLYDPLRYDTEVNINGAPAEVYIDANGNHKINAEIFSTIPGSSGIMMDAEATINAIISDLADDNIANVQVVTYIVEPVLKEENLFEYTSLIYHSKSSIDSSSTYERDQNVALALSKFDGMVIMPGEVVSFNETTGERTAENGFLLAPEISQDKSLQLGYGGGVCQAATVIFNSAIMAGCEILDKDSHSWPMYYQPDDFGTEARDAMVNWGTSDLVFKNTTDYPIYFDTYVFWRNSEDASHAYCNVYTKLLPDGQSIKYDPVLKLNEEAPAPEMRALEDITQYADRTWKLDEETGLLVYKYILSRPYKYYEVQQQIIDSYGNIISEKMWYKAEYKAITGLYYTKPNPNN